VLVAPGLSANQRYAICVKTKVSLDSTELNTFQGTAYEILESTYSGLDSIAGGPPLDLPADSVRSLQLRLYKALPHSEGQRIEVRGTIFDTSRVVSERGLVFTTDVLKWQRDRFNAATTWMEAADTAFAHLSRLAGSATLRKVAGSLSSADKIPGMDPAAVDRAAATARMLASPDSALLQAATKGEVVLQPAATITRQLLEPLDIRSAAEVSARGARTDSTYQRLIELRDVMAAVEATTQLQRKTEIGRAEAMTLRQALDHARDRLQTVRSAEAQWAEDDSNRRGLLLRAARALKVTAEVQVPIVATSISNFETRARQYVTADVGMAYAPGLGEAAPYFGANFYLGALNKRVPISLTYPRRELDRWALTVGVTATSLAKKDVRDDLFASYSLLLGAGRRMTDAIRLTGGAIVYRDRDDNPLLDRTLVALSPFMSLSFDFDARAALGKVADVLFH
jgi:hypothetical protein